MRRRAAPAAARQGQASWGHRLWSSGGRGQRRVPQKRDGSRTKRDLPPMDPAQTDLAQRHPARSVCWPGAQMGPGHCWLRRTRGGGLRAPHFPRGDTRSHGKGAWAGSTQHSAFAGLAGLQGVARGLHPDHGATHSGAGDGSWTHTGSADAPLPHPQGAKRPLEAAVLGPALGAAGRRAPARRVWTPLGSNTGDPRAAAGQSLGAQPAPTAAHCAGQEARGPRSRDKTPVRAGTPHARPDRGLQAAQAPRARSLLPAAGTPREHERALCGGRLAGGPGLPLAETAACSPLPSGRPRHTRRAGACGVSACSERRRRPLGRRGRPPHCPRRPTRGQTRLTVQGGPFTR